MRNYTSTNLAKSDKIKVHQVINNKISIHFQGANNDTIIYISCDQRDKLIELLVNSKDYIGA